MASRTPAEPFCGWRFTHCRTIEFAPHLGRGPVPQPAQRDGAVTDRSGGGVRGEPDAVRVAPSARAEDTTARTAAVLDDSRSGAPDDWWRFPPRSGNLCSAAWSSKDRACSTWGRLGGADIRDALSGGIDASIATGPWSRRRANRCPARAPEPCRWAPFGRRVGARARQRRRRREPGHHDVGQAPFGDAASQTTDAAVSASRYPRTSSTRPDGLPFGSDRVTKDMPPPARVLSCCLGEVLAVPRLGQNCRRHGT